jgi:hypothetical protein
MEFISQNLPLISSVVALLSVLYFVLVSPRRELYDGLPVAMGSSQTLFAAKYSFVWKSREIIAEGLRKVLMRKKFLHLLSLSDNTTVQSSFSGIDASRTQDCASLEVHRRDEESSTSE